jgi:hypothetical protein
MYRGFVVDKALLKGDLISAWVAGAAIKETTRSQEGRRPQGARQKAVGRPEGLCHVSQDDYGSLCQVPTYTTPVSAAA